MLCQLEQKKVSASGLFDTLVGESRLPETDRHLATHIIYGVLRQRQLLEYLLQLLCQRPVSKLKPFIRQTLLTGLYQIFFLDRIPESAAVNESVKAVKNARLPQNLQGFVNAVLRESVRQKESLQQKINKKKCADPFINHPQWLIKRWQDKFGEATTQQICDRNNQQAPLTLHINSTLVTRDDMQAMLSAAGVVSNPGNYSPDALILPEYHGPIRTLPGFAQGFFQVQDEAAALLTFLLTPLKKNGLYLDACAGLGGKTCNLVQMGADLNLTIIAVEPESSRQEKFHQNMLRLHPHAKIPFYPLDLQQFADTSNLQFDGILIDAPCSGTGVIGRHPDIRWNRQESDLIRYQHKQLQLLQQAVRLLKNTGVLVYATCSLETEENEDVVARFLELNPDFTLDTCIPSLPPSAQPLTVGPFFNPRPGLSSDSFFGARLKRRPTVPSQHEG